MGEEITITRTEIHKIHVGSGRYGLCREEHCEAGFPVREWISRTYSYDNGQTWEIWPKTARELRNREE